MKEVKITKKIQSCFDRWGTKLRDGNTDVTHAAYETTASVPPGLFACYETTLKVMAEFHRRHDQPTDWLQFLAFKDGFTLNGPLVPGKSLIDDNNLCVKAIHNSGGYYDLLD